MTKADLTRHALELAEQERFELAHTLWASLDEPNAYQGPLPAWQRQLLDERLETSASEEGATWEQIKGRIWPDAR